MKTTLITGAKGFIGSALMEHLDAVGITDDVRDKEALRPHFKHAEFVIHAAGQVKDIYNEEACFTANVNGTSNVIELCIEYGCKLIHLSSTARQAAYGRSKQAAQQLVADAKGLKAIVLRLCPVVRRDDPLMKWKARYPLEDLMIDIGLIIKNHDFKEYKLVDYKRIEKPYHEKSPDIHKP